MSNSINGDFLKKEYSDFLKPFKTPKKKEELEKDRTGLIEVLERDILIRETQLRLINENEQVLQDLKFLNTKPAYSIPTTPKMPPLEKYYGMNLLSYIFEPFESIFEDFSLLAIPFRIIKAIVFSAFRIIKSIFKIIFTCIKNIKVLTKNIKTKRKYKKQLEQWFIDKQKIINVSDKNWEDDKDNRAYNTLKLNSKAYNLTIRVEFLSYIRDKLNTDVLEIPPKYNFLDLEKNILSCLQNKEADNFYDAINSVKTELQFVRMFEMQRKTLSDFMTNLNATKNTILSHIKETNEIIEKENMKTRKAVSDISGEISSLSGRIADMQNEIKDTLSSVPSEGDMKRLISEGIDGAKVKIDN